MDAESCVYEKKLQAHSPRSRMGIGPLEVLRVALMQGDLDDLRNDLARALRRSDIDTDVLESLLHGLQGLGINLEHARRALGVVDYRVPVRRWRDVVRSTEGPARASERACNSVHCDDQERHPWTGSEGGMFTSVRDGCSPVGELSSISSPAPTTIESSCNSKNPLLWHPSSTDEHAEAATEKENDAPERGATIGRTKKTLRKKRSGGKRWATRR